MSNLHGLITQFLHRYPQFTRLVVAYSGGLDSHVLLHALHEVLAGDRGVRLSAKHVHHGLHVSAEKWADHCLFVCQQLSIPLRVYHVDAHPQLGESIEAKARELRYECLAKDIDNQTCVLTAHHQRDQAETLMLQLMRGSGPKGLAAMPELKVFQAGHLGRPFLSADYPSILEYGRRYALQWIDDPSNESLDLDRNFLRHQIFPILQRRWPTATKTMSRSASHCAELIALMEEEGHELLTHLQGSRHGTLSVQGLMQFSQVEIKHLIRLWLKEMRLTMPSSRQLETLFSDILSANADSTPMLHWAHGEIRRYRDDLHAMPPLPPVEITSKDVLSDSHFSVPAMGDYWFMPSQQGGFAWPAGRTLQIRFRRGGERMQPRGRQGQHSVKNLFQELGIPPWERDRVPLLCDAEHIVALGEWLIDEAYCAKEVEEAYILRRNPAHR